MQPEAQSQLHQTHIGPRTLAPRMKSARSGVAANDQSLEACPGADEVVAHSEPTRRTNGASQDDGLATALDKIASLTGIALRDAWAAVYCSAAPDVPEDLLRLLLAYQIQEARLGGLDEAVSRELEAGAQAHREEGSPRKQTKGAEVGRKPEATFRKGARPASCPSVGTRLIREWNGQTIRVDVCEEGFVWNGVVYASLSAIARAVTGARWSGPRFFGLDGNAARG